MAKKKNIYRFDIWICDFKNNCKSVINGKHPAVIISQWRTNIRVGGSVNVIPLTSNLVKYLDTHIDLKETYNLDKSSKLMCNQILTIDKADVLSFVDKITNIKDQIEIQNAIEKQLDLSSNNFNALDLENLFLDNTKVDNDKVKLENLRSRVYACDHNREYKKAISLALELHELSTKSKIAKRLEFIWYSLYIQATANLGLGNKELALIKIQEALSHISDPEKFSHNYSISMWNLANTYESMGEINDASKIYTSLSHHYKNENETILRLQCIFSVASMKLNKNRMKSICNITKTVVVTDMTVHNCAKYKEEIINAMEDEIEALCI